MKMKFLVGLLILLVGLPLMAAPPKGKSVQTSAQAVDNTSFIAANRIYMFVTNHGNFGRDLGGVFGNDYGTYFPFTSVSDIEAGRTKSPFYAGGLWVGGVDSASGDTLVVVSEYSSEYVPGPSLDGNFQTDRPEFKVYKLFRDSLASNPNADYTNWPWETQGAPLSFDTTFDTTADPWEVVSIDTTPGRIGDQMTWAAYNDYDAAQHDNNNGSTVPLGLDVKQTIFAFERTAGALANIVFLRWQIYNTGDKVLDSCYFSMWSDPDLGTSGDDLVGCDTLLNLAYCYNATNQDNQYASAIPPIVPAIGLDFFQGPLIYTGVETDTAKMWGQKWAGYTNMGLYSFNKYINGTDPDDYAQSYQYMKGLDPKNGAIAFINPITGLETRFVMSGDPVAGTGWLDNAPDDRRMMLTTGPISFRPGDSTEIVGAMVIGQGGDYLSSITVMKGIDAYAQKLYELDFRPPEPPAKPVVTVHALPGEITISWTDTSEVSPGDYNFEGYTLWQGESSSGPWTEIKTWDIVDQYVGGMIDTVFVANAGQPLPVSMRAVTNSGLNYSYTFTRDMITGSRLYDVTEYYYKVSAFAWGTTFQGSPVTAGDHFLESETAVTAIPQSPKAGYTPDAVAHSDVEVAHSGPSQGTVTVEVIEPMALTGHDYSVTFGLYPDTTIGWSQDTTFNYTYDTLTDTCDFGLIEGEWTAILCVDTTLDSVSYGELVYDTTVTDVPYWDLNDLTLDTVILSRQTNQTGDDEYFVADGFLCKVAGPDPGIRFFDCVANAAGVLDPPEGAAAPWATPEALFPVRTDPATPDVDGRPTERQQVGPAEWLIHTGDNGGSSGGGTRTSFTTFLERTFRADQGRLDRLGAYDFEWRFTAEGGYGWDAFNTGNACTVPFELWRIGIATPDDPSDDLRLIPWVLGDATGDGSGDNFIFDLSQYGAADTCHDGCEHSVSGGDNDPYTDWVYWRLPEDETAGEAGYNAFEAAMISDPTNWSGNELPIMDRMVLVNWNGGGLPPFAQDMPETGTVFRITTFKPNSPLDEFTFTTPAPTYARSEEALDAIKAVPNPFYLYGPYDPAVGNYQIKFHHLPQECSISIYNLAGDFITRIDKNDDTPFATWNLQTDNRIPVASGIYIYVVDAPGFGQKIGKMAVFYEQEVLTIY
jgi:hypothetical protein